MTISGDHLAAVELGWSKNGPRVVGHANTTLGDGAVRPAINTVNIEDPDGIARALRKLFGQLPRRPTRVALVLPDSTAKVSLVRFEKVPTRESDLSQLIRWHVRKAAPFRVEDAQVSYAAGAKTADGRQEFVVAQIRRDIVEQYEKTCAAAGAHAGCVDLASFNVINAALSTAVEAETGDWLLVHMGPGQCTLAIVRGTNLIFFRNRSINKETSLADLVHQTAMYHEDRLGGAGFFRAVLAGHSVIGGDDNRKDAVRTELEDRLQTVVEPIGTRLAAHFEQSTGNDVEMLDHLAAPLGILLRARHLN